MKAHFALLPQSWPHPGKEREKEIIYKHMHACKCQGLAGNMIVCHRIMYITVSLCIEYYPKCFTEKICTNSVKKEKIRKKNTRIFKPQKIKRKFSKHF